MPKKADDIMDQLEQMKEAYKLAIAINPNLSDYQKEEMQRYADDVASFMKIIQEIARNIDNVPRIK